MARVTEPARPANRFAPRIARLRVPHGTKGRRSIDTTDPDALLKELVLRAIDRFEEAHDFAALARRLAAANAAMSPRLDVEPGPLPVRTRPPKGSLTMGMRISPHDHNEDCTAEEFRESAYRRGVQHGIVRTLEAIDKGASREVLDRFESEVTDWRSRLGPFEAAREVVQRPPWLFGIGKGLDPRKVRPIHLTELRQDKSLVDGKVLVHRTDRPLKNLGDEVRHRGGRLDGLEGRAVLFAALEARYTIRSAMIVGGGSLMVHLDSTLHGGAFTHADGLWLLDEWPAPGFKPVADDDPSPKALLERSERKKHFVLMSTERFLNSLAVFVRERGYCRAGLVGMKVIRFGVTGPCTIHRTAWVGHHQLKVLIEPDEGDGMTMVELAEDLYLADDWPVTCCTPRDKRPDRTAGEALHPLESAVLPLLWKSPGLDAAAIGAALSGSTERDEATGLYEGVATDALRVLHRHGVVEHDEAGRYSLAKPTCPAERAEVQP